jgi:hypothetical protein
LEELQKDAEEVGRKVRERFASEDWRRQMELLRRQSDEISRQVQESIASIDWEEMSRQIREAVDRATSSFGRESQERE